MNEAVRQAIHDAIANNPAGLKGEAIAARMAVSISVLYRWGELSGKPIPLDRLKQFVLVTGDMRPITALCREVGGLFIPCPQDDGNGADAGAMRALKEFSDLMQESSSALMDGKVSQGELIRIRREGAEAQRELARFLNSIEERAAGAVR